MVKYFFLGGILLLALLTESLSEKDFWRAIRQQSLSDDSREQRLLSVPYEQAPGYRVREREQGRRQFSEESRPLCEEERKSLDVRELIELGASSFIQTSSDLNLRKYHLIPRKVDMIKCVGGHSNEDSEAVCKAENCRERKVDIEVFGRLRNETGNVWRFVGTLSAVPVACECFVRWKPHKCSRSFDISGDF